MMRPLMRASLAALLALPMALLTLATPPPERLTALLATLPALVGLAILERALRAHASEGSAFWTLAMGVYGTGLFPLLAQSPDPRRATAFLAGALGLLAALRGAAWTPRRLTAFAAMIVTGGAIGGSLTGPLQSPDLPRALFGSRDGLLFFTPLLWACLAGLARLVRTQGRRAVPIVVASLAPFALAPFFAGGGRVERYDWALPSLLIGLAAGLDALREAVERRPAWLLAALATALGTSNLLFMEQYRQSLRRDDTVALPEVSEGNARLLARAAGSPLAWPANWIWSARQGLPAERWDLLSGYRLDPHAADAATIDIGERDQDAAFLFDGWGVRSVCGDAVCREIAGRAEAVLPLESAGPLRASLRVYGSGALHVELNQAALTSVRLGPELAWRELPNAAWRRGPNRLVFVVAPGSQAFLEGVRLSRGD